MSLCGILLPIRLIIVNPRLHPPLHREMPLGISRVLGVQLVDVDFEGNPFVAAAASITLNNSRLELAPEVLTLACPPPAKFED